MRLYATLPLSSEHALHFSVEKAKEIEQEVILTNSK